MRSLHEVQKTYTGKLCLFKYLMEQWWNNNYYSLIERSPTMCLTRLEKPQRGSHGVIWAGVQGNGGGRSWITQNQG
jgi:hypothetical protein